MLLAIVLSVSGLALVVVPTVLCFRWRSPAPNPIHSEVCPGLRTNNPCGVSLTRGDESGPPLPKSTPKVVRRARRYTVILMRILQREAVDMMQDLVSILLSAVTGVICSHG